jgi:membrane protein
MFANVIANLRWFYANIVEQFGAHGLLNNAAALTYTTLFAVVPLMTLSYAILSMFPDFSALGQQIQTFVFENFVPSSSAIVQQKLSDFSQQARELTFAGFLVLFLTAFMTLVNIEAAFNEIWQVAEPRRGLQRFVVYWAVMTFGPPLVVGGLFVSSYLMSLPLIAESDTVAARQALLGYLPFLFSAAGFTVLFYAMPNCRVRFRDAFIGGLVTMAFFEGAKRLFTSIVAQTNMQLIYGTFAAVPLFLTWLYLTWVLILSGAIVVRTLGMPRRDSAQSDGIPALVQCVRILAFLQRAHREGRPVTRRDLNDAVKLSGGERDRVFAAIGELGLLSDAGNQVLLARDLRGVTLYDLYERLPYGIDADALTRVRDLPQLVALLTDYVRYGAEHLRVDVDRVASTDLRNDGETPA